MPRENRRHHFLSASVILSTSILSAALAFVERHPGIVIVLIGVAGEVFCDWKTIEGKWAMARKAFAVLLVIGLAWELIEAGKSDAELAEAKRISGSAFERAAVAEREASQANERASETESNNLALSIKLEKLKQPRIITDEQITNFIFLTKKIAKIPVRVLVSAYGDDTAPFAMRFREMLNAAEFGRAGNEVGIARDTGEGQTGYLGRSFDMKGDWPSIVCLTYSTNGVNDFSTFNQELTNGWSRPIITDTNTSKAIYNGIVSCLNQIGIKTMWVSKTNWEGWTWIEPGGTQFYIPPKNN
jgi:hypothetical protein